MRDCGLLWPDISVPEGKLVGIAIMGADALRKSSASFLSSGFSCRPVSHQGQGSDGSALCGDSFTEDGRNACCFAVTARKTGDQAGVIPILDIDESERIIELGCPLWTAAEVSPRAAAEALCLALGYVFDDLGCLRCCTWRGAHDPDSALMCDLGFCYDASDSLRGGNLGVRIWDIILEVSIHAPCGCDVRQCRNFSRTQSGILQNWPCYDWKNIQLFASEEAEHLFHSFMITATDGAIKF